MKQRGRKEENSVSLEHLKQIHQIHDDWLYHQTFKPPPAPIVTIDADQDIQNMVEEFEKCKKQIFNRIIDDSGANNTMITTVSKNCILSEMKAGISD